MTTSLNEFINHNRIHARAEWTDDNPGMSDMPAGSSHWRVILTRSGKRMTVPFSQGPAISREPTAEDVLDCLASDAASFENAQSFEDWASEYGYDADSRKAERIYRAVEKQTVKLRAFMGELYQPLLWDIER